MHFWTNRKYKKKFKVWDYIIINYFDIKFPRKIVKINGDEVFVNVMAASEIIANGLNAKTYFGINVKTDMKKIESSC